MEPSRFDDLTKALATATSRRQALRRIGGILGGTALAGLFPGLALASNSACAKFCNKVFGADTPAANQCTSDAAHHKGLCYTCGPASPGGTQPICCPQNPDSTCTSYSSATCCSSGQSCCSGAQQATCFDSQSLVCCPGGYTCPNNPNNNCCTSDADCAQDQFCFRGCCMFV